MPVELTQPTTTIALRPNSPAISFKQHERSHPQAAILAQPAVATREPTPADRLQISEAPENGFRYPIAPNPTLIGKVSLKAVIGIDGSVKEVDVLSGKRPLARAAVRAVQHWRYRPPDINGHAVEAETSIVISFVGEDAVSVSFPAAR